MIYIASPFFNEKQLQVVKLIEDALRKEQIEFFSPRLEGGSLKDMSPEERKNVSKEIYYMNLDAIESAHIMISIIDDFDPGTMFELGYAAGIIPETGICIITYSAEKHGLNVMLAHCSDGHANDIPTLIHMIKEYLETGIISDNSITEVVT